MKKDLSPTLGNITAESLQSMIDGMKAYRDFGDGIDDDYALSLRVEATGNGFTVTYTFCKGEIRGYGYGPDRVDAEPVLGDGKFFITRNQSHKDLVKYMEDVFDEVTAEPYNELIEEF